MFTLEMLGRPPLALVLICLFVVLASNGLVGPNAMALSLNDFPQAAGSASALLGVLQFSIGAIVAPLVGLGGNHDAKPMAVAIFVLGIAAIGTRLLLTHSPAGARVAVRAPSHR